jgi:AmmeMemoRadiSam system protein B
LADAKELFAADDRLHRNEHAVEVELPLIRSAWPNARLLPIETPPRELAVEIGRRVAQACEREKLRTIFLASSDLTHYGPDYRFIPAGVGQQALAWAKDNDRRLLRIVEEMRPEDVVAETSAYHNACGGGAIAAMLAACRHFGASAATVLTHASSYETLAAVAPQPAVNAVGYASAVVW